MDIINIEFENWCCLSIKLNYIAIILLFVILFGVSIIVKSYYHFYTKIPCT